MKAHDYNHKSKEELLSIIEKQAKQISILEESILAYRHRQYANKCETSKAIQQSLFDDAQLPKNEEKLLAQEELTR